MKANIFLTLVRHKALKDILIDKILFLELGLQIIHLNIKEHRCHFTHNNQDQLGIKWHMCLNCCQQIYQIDSKLVRKFGFQYLHKSLSMNQHKDF